MSNGEHCAVKKLLADCVLYEIVCVVVDRGRCLVQNENLRLAQQCASQTDQLSLANTEVETKMS